MNKPFRRGVLAGILAPLAFLAGIVFWIYKATGKIPCPTQRLEEDGVAIRLVKPDRVAEYWDAWQEELRPIFDRIYSLVNTARERHSHR
ncbi:MAG: hypothetical protein U9R48_00430 [Chloroflexota bacterium]|nr:hypothetical protein [Chloroflexota bacterium]